MDQLAFHLLTRLLNAADKHTAGTRTRLPSLTKSAFKGYAILPHSTRLLCEESLLSASNVGAISIFRDKGNIQHGLIEKITLLDIHKLAYFLGKDTLTTKVSAARSAFVQHLSSFPVLNDVITAWHTASKVRGLGPESYPDWLHAVEAVSAARSRLKSDSTSLPIREFSAKLFQDSKRVERLTVHADVLISESIHSTPRPLNEVWQELGLFREEQPVLLAGNVAIARSRVSGLIDEPYAAYKAEAVLSIQSEITRILTIENLTTFHDHARRYSSENSLFIYTGGMPSPSWRAMYSRLLNSVPSTVDVSHWGDIDEGGYRIAYLLSRDAHASGHTLNPYKMSPVDIIDQKPTPAADALVERMANYCSRTGWLHIADQIREFRFTIEQEQQH